MMKIIFLDVDGPLIPLRLHKSTGGHLFKYDMLGGYYVWDPVFVQALNDHCPPQNIKLVFNSAHNINGSSILRSTAAANKLNPSLLHNDTCTKYPDMVNKVDAIYDWLHRNVPLGDSCKWMTVDDFDLPIGNHLVSCSLQNGMTVNLIDKLFGSLLLQDRPTKSLNIVYYNEANTGDPKIYG